MHMVVANSTKSITHELLEALKAERALTIRYWTVLDEMNCRPSVRLPDWALKIFKEQSRPIPDEVRTRTDDIVERVAALEGVTIREVTIRTEGPDWARYC